MTSEEARYLAQAIRDALPMKMRRRLKAIHVACKLHNGHMTARVFMTNVTAEDPDPYVFPVEEL